MIPIRFHSLSKYNGRVARSARRAATVKLRLERFEERTVPAFLPTNYAAGAGAASVVTADFQGLADGNVDFATANIGANTVSVFLNNHDGTGTFRPAVNYAVGGAPLDIVAGDLTGDGLPDIVVTDSNSNTVTILYNDPAHPDTFQPRVALLGTGGSGPRDVRLAELTGDGFLDIITANYDNNTVAVLLGNGDGSFAPAHTYAASAGSSGAYALAVADFYGDGFPSVAVSNPVRGVVDILRGNHDGTLQPFHQVATPGHVTGLAAGDLGNGNIDLVSANNSSGGVNVLLNDGAGNFTSRHYNITPIQAPFRVFLGDVNGDGNLDVVTDNIASTGPGNISILYGNGDGTLQPAVAVNSGGDRPSGVAVADLEGDFAVDGKNDIIVSNNASNNATVLLHNPAPAVLTTTLTGEFENQTVSSGDVIFSDPVDPNTFVYDYDEFSLVDPHGIPVRVTNISPTDGTNMRFHVTFTPQSAPGTYHLTIGPDIYDPTDKYQMSAPYVGEFLITINLLVNGGFETGNFPPWIQFGDTEYSGVDNSTNIPVHSGNYAAYFGPLSLGGISQTVTTTPGQTYQLRFWLSHPFDDLGMGSEFQVKIGGTTVDDQFNAGNFNYTRFTYTYIATGTSTSIQLGFAEPPHYFYLDDVSFGPTGDTGLPSNTNDGASLASAIGAGKTIPIIQSVAHAPVGAFGLGASSVEAQQPSVAVEKQVGPSAAPSDVALNVLRQSDSATRDSVSAPDATDDHVVATNVLFSDPLLSELFNGVL
jgi:hypothetical protein